MPNTKSNLSSKSKTIRFSTNTRCLYEKCTRTTRFSVLTAAPVASYTLRCVYILEVQLR
ncbi:hypothetical protein PC118_g23195 [Phytophthora cactorum]|uniref:Uncharacterized protein n=1 Tax=Phytophthora cactorum TaxID=29920 RepID=A0A8T1EXL1_9STRA|nr:hypothetical protein PC118_g23195 [Phytophthora cactorum]